MTYINTLIIGCMDSNMFSTRDHLIHKNDGINKRTNEGLKREASGMKQKSFEYTLVLVKVNISLASFWRNLRLVPSMRPLLGPSIKNVVTSTA